MGMTLTILVRVSFPNRSTSTRVLDRTRSPPPCRELWPPPETSPRAGISLDHARGRPRETSRLGGRSGVSISASVVQSTTTRPAFGLQRAADVHVQMMQSTIPGRRQPSQSSSCRCVSPLASERISRCARRRAPSPLTVLPSSHSSPDRELRWPHALPRRPQLCTRSRPSRHHTCRRPQAVGPVELTRPALGRTVGGEAGVGRRRQPCRECRILSI